MYFRNFTKLMAKHTTFLARARIREVFRDHRGASKQIAEALGKTQSSLSAWLAGGPNRNFDKTIPAIAKRLNNGEPLQSILESIRGEVAA